MNHIPYQDWVLLQKSTGKNWPEIINLAINEFSHEIPKEKPKLPEDISFLFSCLSEEIDTPEEVNSLLLDIMLYCEGEDTGFYDPYNKEALLAELNSLIKKYS